MTSLCWKSPLVIVTAVFFAYFFAQAQPKAVATSDLSNEAQLIRSLALLDQDGKTFHFSQVLGRTVLLNFVFTGCGSICPVQTTELANVARALPAEVRDRVVFVSVSVDPVNDTPETLRHFADERGVDLSRWFFVTGDEAAILRVLAFFNPTLPGTADPVGGHSTQLKLFDAAGIGMQRYQGQPVDQTRIVADLAIVSHLNDIVY